MAGVAEYGYFGHPSVQLHRYLPERRVAVDALTVGVEAAVYGADQAASAAGKPLDGSQPEFGIRHQRILDEYRQARTLQGIGYLLHQKRIAGGPCSYPYRVYSVFEDNLHVSGIRYLGDGLHAGGPARIAEPPGTGLSDSLEAAGMSTGLPGTARLL